VVGEEDAVRDWRGIERDGGGKRDESREQRRREVTTGRGERAVNKR
jgi:hypothetical protein